MGLQHYREKRDFSRTPEPAGTESTEDQGRFVVHKHAASHLHYDFRLELDGVLKSWAVPKGPSLDPNDRRLAVHVEDHPIEYGDFEGVIPRGEYGGGSVMVWDRGRWIPEGDPREGYRRGRLRFRLEGIRLRGAWRLVRAGASDDGKEPWFLMKVADEEADGSTPEIDESVVSGRTMAQIAADQDRTWSGRTGHRVPEAPERPLPQAPAFAETVPAASPPEGSGWLHEIGYPGERVLARIVAGRVFLRDLHGVDRTARFPGIAAELRALPVSDALLDGILVALDARGMPVAGDPTLLVCFDLLHLDGRDVTGVPQQHRKQVLSEVLAGARRHVRYSDHVVGDGPIFLEQARALGIGAVVSKKTDAPYLPGPSGSWLRIPCVPALRLTHPERVLWPDVHVTKRELADYYVRIADRILPHVLRRPLTLLRCPDGVPGPCFFQRHVGDTMPDSVHGVVVPGHGEGEAHLWVDSLDGLLGLVQMSALEIHPWGTGIDDLRHPDRIIFDLDPDVGLPWERVTEAALRVRARLLDLGLASWVKTTGGKGLHVVVPLTPTRPWEEVKEFCRLVAESIVAEEPTRYTSRVARHRRQGRVFLDWLRNTATSTAVAPWSTRARPGAPVAAPISWEDLADFPRFTVRDFPAYDAWKGLGRHPQEISDTALHTLRKPR